MQEKGDVTSATTLDRLAVLSTNHAKAPKVTGMRGNLPYRITTSRFQNSEGIVGEGLAAVRITLGHPRFRLGYELAGTIKALAPTREEFMLDEEQLFSVAYRSRLDNFGIELIKCELDRIVTTSGRSGLCLCCYEDLARGGFCHRRVAAEWLEEQLGIEVPELP